MKRIDLTPRPDWRRRLADLGVDLETESISPYWREDAAYVFSAAEIEQLHAAASELQRLVIAATGHVIENDLFAELGILPPLAALAKASWDRDEQSIYGRMDLRFDGTNPPKLLEYNADTPTALFEAAVVQWHWLTECFPGRDQYNSIHEGLIAAWARWRREGRPARLHFACMPEDDDDLLTTAYLQDCAHQAGLATSLMEMAAIGWDGRKFVDLAHARIDALFKLYPWDWLEEETFFEHLLPGAPVMVEPAWRVVPASKGILAVLWDLFPGHPNLLPAGFEASAIPGPRILKPLLGREGANMIVEGDERQRHATDGPYGDMPVVAQAFAPLPAFDGWHPVIGAWIIDGDPHGIGIREDRNLVTGREGRFVPHYMAD